MRVSRVRVASLVVAGALLALVAGPALAARVAVAVVDRAFVGPDGSSTVTIDPGDTVVWRAQGIGTDHTVTGGARGSPPATWLFEVTFSKSGDRFEWTYPKAGTYPFHCAFHPGMDGVVVVRGATGTVPPEPTPGPSPEPDPTTTPASSAPPSPTPGASPSVSPSPAASATSAPSGGPSPSSGPSAAPPASPAPSPSAAPHEPRVPVTAESRVLAVTALVGATLLLLGLTSLYRRVNR